MNSSQNKSKKNTPGKKRRASDNSKVLSTCKRKSLRMQHSLSLHIPMDELDSTNVELNCYISLPQQVFNLTFMEANETQNPEQLNVLKELNGKNWKVYLVTQLHNFRYLLSQLRSVEKSLQMAFKTEFQNSSIDMTYHCELSISEDLAPTENDNTALVISVIGSREGNQKRLFMGYLLSWCSPVKDKSTRLPIMLCNGNQKFRRVVNRVLCEKFDAITTELTLTQEEFMHLSTYCLIMLDENESSVATFSYATRMGKIKISIQMEYLLKLWKTIHQSDSNEVEFEEILCFHDSLEKFIETTFGIKLGYAHFIYINVKPMFFLHANAQIRSKSTKIMHVVLKYLNCLVAQKLKVNVLNNCERDIYQQSALSEK